MRSDSVYPYQFSQSSPIIFDDEYLKKICMNIQYEME